MGSVQDFILLPLCMVNIKRINRQGESKIPTPMVKSSSADLLPAIKTYWAESHLESILWLNPRA